MQISKRIEWCMGHRLQGHGGKCVNLHGHQYVLEIVVEGEVNVDRDLSSRGMVVDFGDIKKLLDEKIHDICDHAFMVSDTDEIMVLFFKQNPDLKHVVVPFDSTAENMVNWIFTRLSKSIANLPGSPKLVSARLWETPYNWAQIGQ